MEGVSIFIACGTVVSTPRIGLDARSTAQMSVGMKAYAREMAARLPNVASEFTFVAFTKGRNFGWQEQVAMPLAMRRARLDLVHFLSLYVPLIVPGCSVVTIHDLIHLLFPEQFKAKVGPYYRTVVRWACAHAARVITDDERTVADLQRFLNVDRRKVRVIPLGVDELFLRDAAPFTAARPYLLYVGNHRKHKDLPTLFDAWSALPAERGIDLYVTGPDDFAGELQRRSSASRAIIALGDVPAEQLAAYYAGAMALVTPARREGFGLPMVEAMAVGCPVVACADAVPGVLARAALTFGAGNAAELRAVLEQLAGDEVRRARIVNLGRETARSLTWDRCARATAEVYREVLEL